MSTTAGRAASVLRHSVVYSGSAIVNGVNAITPHLAGAVDILVARQPDGSLKSTPFYVRFGKYSSFRVKDRTVRIFVNGKMTSLTMHLGSYGQAYFIAETEISDQTDAFDGLLSSQSGYSSNEDEDDDAPYANAEILETVQMEVCKIQEPGIKADISCSTTEITVAKEDSLPPQLYDVDERPGATDGVSVKSESFNSTDSQAREEIPSEDHSDEEFMSTRLSPESSANHNNTVNYVDQLGSEGDKEYDSYLQDHEINKSTGLSLPLQAMQSTSAEGLFGQLELSLCGHYLLEGIAPEEAQRVFDVHKVSKETFELSAAAITTDPDLMCRWKGMILSWAEAAPIILGTLAFGGSWEHLAPGTILRESEGNKQPAKVSSGWSLWPFAWTSSSKEDPQTVTIGEGLKQRIIHRKVLTPTPEQLESLDLVFGQNVIAYQIGESVQQKAYIYLIDWSSRLVISDIDGTVTRSDILGHILTPIGVDWTHSGVAHLFKNIAENGYQIMFLSSRAIAQANITREFLHRLEQEGVKMPMGPVIISPHGLLPSLYREMILRRPHEFKISCLQEVRNIFPDHWNPFYAGFGNRETDVISYEESGVPPSRIFTINPRGEIIRGTTSSVQTSTWSSLKGINGLVDEVFPFYSKGETAEMQREEFNDFHHWRTFDSFYSLDDPELCSSDFHSVLSKQSSGFKWD